MASFSSSLSPGAVANTLSISILCRALRFAESMMRTSARKIAKTDFDMSVTVMNAAKASEIE